LASTARAFEVTRRARKVYGALMVIRRFAGFAIGVLLLSGCTTGAVPPTPEPVAETRTEVDWDAYPPSYQQIADEETEQKDCEALQDMFDIAPDDPNVLRYLDEALRIADCY